FHDFFASFQGLVFNSKIRLAFDSTFSEYRLDRLKLFIAQTPSFALNVAHLSVKSYDETGPEIIQFIADHFANLECLQLEFSSTKVTLIFLTFLFFINAFFNFFRNLSLCLIFQKIFSE